jgi:acetylglutamate/LysW-gamma-L-alpha-aminoadipate kinase
MDVVKIGGAQGIDGDGLAKDLAGRWAGGWRGVLVHGGSDATNQLAESLGHPPEFVTSVSGQVSRRTDRRTLEIFVQATALVNRLLVERLQGLGVDAVGLSGLDGGLIGARRKDAIRILDNGRQRILRDDWTGTPTRTRTTLLHLLIDAGHLPVIAPLARGGDGEMLNVDGDRAAACVAAALDATHLVILSNVPGLLRDVTDVRSVVPHVRAGEIDAVRALAKGRMQKKVMGAEEALRAGVRSVIIADARIDAPLTEALLGHGTVFGQPIGATLEHYA